MLHDIIDFNRTELSFYTGSQEVGTLNIGSDIRNLTLTNQIADKAIMIYNVHTEDQALKVNKQFLPVLIRP